MEKTNIVAAVKCNNYEKKELLISLNKGISLVNPKIEKAKNIIIKPNISSISSINNVTNPLVVESLIEILRKKNRNCKISIVESDSHKRTAEQAFETYDYQNIKKKYKNVNLINLSKDKKVKIIINGNYFETIDLPLSILNADFLISVGKMKTDEFQKTSGVLKNNIGLIDDFSTKGNLFLLDKAIVDVNKLIKTDFCIIDGISAIEGRGPEYGKAREEKILFFSNNPISVDKIATEHMGFSALSNPHINLASKQMEGFSNIYLAGDQIMKSNFEFINPVSQILYHNALMLQKASHENEKRSKAIRKKSEEMIEKGKFVSYTLERYGKGIIKKAINRYLFKKYY